MNPDPITPPEKRRSWTPAEVREVRSVRDFLASHSGECYDPGPGLKACGECEPCILAKAIERLGYVVDPPDQPVERYRERLNYNGGLNGEAALLSAWREEQQRTSRSSSSRVTVLEHVLGERPTFRDAEVAATLICWLGTNIGREFFNKMTRALKQNDDDVRAKKDRENAELMEQRRPKPSDQTIPADAKWFVVDNAERVAEGARFTHLAGPFDTAADAGSKRREMEKHATEAELRRWNLWVVWETPEPPEE